MARGEANASSDLDLALEYVDSLFDDWPLETVVACYSQVNSDAMDWAEEAACCPKNGNENEA